MVRWDFELHGHGVAEYLHQGGSSGELERLLATQLNTRRADEGDFSCDAACDTQHGGTANVPGGLHL